MTETIQQVRKVKKIALDLCGVFPGLTSLKKEDKIDIKWRKF
jgi:hypothetical protein